MSPTATFKPNKNKPLTELALIEMLRARSAGKHKNTLIRGIGDDCAILRVRNGEDVVATTDFSLEKVHFRRDWHSPESAGHRCLTRGLSDLAAMGARPIGALLSLAVPRNLTERPRGRPSWTERFFEGLLALAEHEGVPLAGGDTACSADFELDGARHPGLVTADIVLLGAVGRGRAILRSGARPGDLIYVTGSLGGAAGELQAIRKAPARFRTRATGKDSEHPHLFPQARLAAGQALAARQLATAAIDTSDGLSTDLRHICEASDVAAEIDAAAIPIHPVALSVEARGLAPSALHLALHGGEDYELLFTAPAGKHLGSSVAGVPVHAIGRILRRRRGAPSITIFERDGSRELEAGGWEHFKDRV